jgi:hypothetical protein
VIRATFDVRPMGSAEAFAGLGGAVVAAADGTVTVELDEAEWGDHAGLLVNPFAQGLGSSALGGGMAPGDVATQLDAAGPGGLLVLLGSGAHRFAGGLQAAVAAGVEAL